MDQYQVRVHNDCFSVGESDTDPAIRAWIRVFYETVDTKQVLHIEIFTPDQHNNFQTLENERLVLDDGAIAYLDRVTALSGDTAWNDLSCSDAPARNEKIRVLHSAVMSGKIKSYKIEESTGQNIQLIVGSCESEALRAPVLNATPPVENAFHVNQNDRPELRGREVIDLTAEDEYLDAEQSVQQGVDVKPKLEPTDDIQVAPSAIHAQYPLLQSYEEVRHASTPRMVGGTSKSKELLILDLKDIATEKKEAMARFERRENTIKRKLALMDDDEHDYEVLPKKERRG